MSTFTRSLRLFSIASTALLLAVGGAQAAKLVKTNAGIGPKHPVNLVAYPTFSKSVEEKTKGSLTFKHFSGGSLLSLKATLSGLRDGIADMGMVVFPYHRAELRASQVVGDLSNLGKDLMVMAGAATEFYMLHCPGCQKEQAAQGILTLTGIAVPPYLLISKEKITTLADIKGKKVRTGGGSFGLWGQHVGATVVNIPVNEMYDAFNHGVIEAGVQTEAGLKAYGFWDTAKHVTMLRVGTYSAGTMLGTGTEFWKGLTASERRALMESAPLALRAMVESYDAALKAVIAPAKEMGVQFHAPSADLADATRDFDRTSVANAKKIAKEKHGVADADALIDTYVSVIEKWTKLVKPIRNDYDGFQAALNREIYNKLDAKRWGL